MIQRVSFPPLPTLEVGDAKGRRGFGEGGGQEGLEELLGQKGRGQERIPEIPDWIGMEGTLGTIQLHLGSLPVPEGGSWIPEHPRASCSHPTAPAAS